jgi:hypothetical protein
MITNLAIRPAGLSLTLNTFGFNVPIWGTTMYWSAVAMSATGQKQVLVASPSTSYSLIFISTDYGQTWTQSTSYADAQVNYNAIDCSSDFVYQSLAVNNGKIFTSVDSGITWVQKTTLSGAYDICLSQTGAKQYCCATNGVYVSSDYGSTWSLLTASSSFLQPPKVVATSSDGTKITVGTDVNSTTNLSYIYTSSNSGATWTQRVGDAGSRPFRSVAMSSDGTKQIGTTYGSTVYLSSDSGVTWTQGPYFSAIKVAMSSDGNKMTIVGQDNSTILYSLDSGVNWNSIIATKAVRTVAMSSTGTIQTIAGGSNALYNATIS